MSVHNYYAELQKGMIRAEADEEMEDIICHFYSRLHTEIQDITDYKEYGTVNHLFQLAMAKRIAGSPTDENKDLLHTSFNIYGPIQNCYAFRSSFLNDKFGIMSSFHVVDTFYNSTSCYGLE
jgi:hypothetical protein